MTPSEQIAEINNRFTYHKPVGDQVSRYGMMRSKARDLALHIAANTPQSREQSVAITKLDEVMMWANAAIARNETTPAVDGEPEEG